MDSLSKPQHHPSDQAPSENPLRRLWRHIMSVKARAHDRPVTLSNLSAHIRRDIGLMDIGGGDRPTTAAWLDNSAFIGRGP